jgi:outer membrane protein OmpA-like peptidoglycan-associated protein
MFSMTKAGLVACVTFLPCLALAQPVVGPYVSLGAGVNLQQDEIIKPDALIPVYGDHHYSFDTGFNGQISAGWGFGYGFRAEVEADYFTNSVDGHGPGSVPETLGGTEQKYGGMANILYDFDFGLPVYPYVGVGLGGQVVEHDHFFNRSIFAPPFPSGANTQAKGSYAYQGIAGVAFPLPILPGLSATLEYRFKGMFDPVGPYDSVVYNAANPGGLPVERKFTNDLNHSILLGVRYALWQPPPPPPPPPPAAAPPPPAPEAARTYLVFFDWDRADLTARARQIVAEAASASTHVTTTRIEVNGYTDLSGTAAYNQRLSVRRAQSVEAELVRDGVAQNEISIHGYGESNPLVPTAKGVREPQNRRVEIILK